MAQAPGPRLDALDGQSFDVAIIGAGVNGCATAQRLASAGYSVLLVDKGDFCSGASSRSSRMLSCGIIYLAPNTSLWNYLRDVRALRGNLASAREAMAARSDFLATVPERIRRVPFAVPIYRSDNFRPWQVRLAFRLLRWLGPGDVPLDFRFVRPGAPADMPLLGAVRQSEDLLGFCVFREHHYDWPERIALDMVADAERLGAVARNYAMVTGLQQGNDQRWSLTVRDADAPHVTARVTASIVCNLAGAWIDTVNTLAEPRAARTVYGTKGIHIAVRLPERFRMQGVCGFDRSGHRRLYCFPWRDFHFFGPTETPYEGDPSQARPEEDELLHLLDEVNHLFPGLGPLRREDILYSWAGVRPLTYDPATGAGARGRTIHDLAAKGLPNVFAMTSGLLKTQRIAGAELCALVAQRLQPSRPPRPFSLRGEHLPVDAQSPPLVAHWPVAREADLLRAAGDGHVRHLYDLFTRVGLIWTETMGAEAAQSAAELVAPVLGWDEARVSEEVERFAATLARDHGVASRRSNRRPANRGDPGLREHPPLPAG
ncbi:MAG: FAD-dependent oxidoreductase [Acidisphaera sp.]|nr:FAD-dependent oxidoreductase [Acidisphaera sp.]